MNHPSFYRRWRASRKIRHFLGSGMKPWSRGYIEYKNREIGRILADDGFPADQLPKGYGYRLDERIIEYPWFFSRLPVSGGILLDAGSVLNFSFLLDHRSLRAKKLHICTLAPESECFWDRGISYLFDDLRRLPYQDNWFDWVVCLSTLEHVGMDNTLLYTADTSKKEAQLRDYLRAVTELRRVLKPGGTLFASVPCGQARDHGWLQIFDRQKIDELLQAFGPASAKQDFFLYQSEGWRRCSWEDAAGATFFDIHHAAGFDADFAASARAVCCLELRKP